MSNKENKENIDNPMEAAYGNAIIDFGDPGTVWYYTSAVSNLIEARDNTSGNRGKFDESIEAILGLLHNTVAFQQVLHNKYRNEYLRPESTVVPIGIKNDK